MLQWTRPGYGIEIVPSMRALDESEKYVEMSFSDDSSVEELTTYNYETSTEKNPPISTPTASTTEATESPASPMLMRLIGSDPLESSEEMLTEAPIISSDSIQDEQPEINVKKATSKSIKPRLLDTKPEEILIKPEHKDDETLEIIIEETTPIADIDAELNETIIDIAEEPTTIQPPTSKKPKKIEIYKTRPNELLRHYVEDSHLRSPVAALIDKKTNPLMKAKKLWKAALKPNTLLDIMVVSYDSEGKIIVHVKVTQTHN